MKGINAGEEVVNVMWPSMNKKFINVMGRLIVGKAARSIVLKAIRSGLTIGTIWSLLTTYAPMAVDMAKRVYAHCIEG